jgi:glycerophosphoryl diester phosphodiesterase
MKSTWLFLLFAALSCSTPKTVVSTGNTTVKNNMTEQKHSANTIAFDMEGHRGCRGLMPENTVPAMLKALELGVTTLEMDVVFTSDKQAILSHEPFFNHEITTKPNGASVTETEEQTYNIYHMTYAATQTFDVGMKPHPRFPDQQKLAATKPLLSTVIDSAETYAKTHNRALPFYNIETKTTAFTDDVYHPGPAEFVELMMKVINDKKINSRVIIQSFDVRTLQYLHTKYPAMKTALLIEDFDKQDLDLQLNILGFTPDIYSPDDKLVTPELISRCHAKNIRVIPYTVNKLEKMQKLKDMGVDGLISDYPNLYKQLE